MSGGGGEISVTVPLCGLTSLGDALAGIRPAEGATYVPSVSSKTACGWRREHMAPPPPSRTVTVQPRSRLIQNIHGVAERPLT